MKNTLYKTLVLFIVSAVVISALPVASALSLKERNANWVNEYYDAKTKYLTALNEWEKDRQHWLYSADKVQDLKDLKRTDAFFTEAQEFELSALDVMDTHNDVYIVWAENIVFESEDLRKEVLDQLYYNRAKIEDLRESVLNAQNGQELVDESKKVKDYWFEQRESVKWVSGVLLSQRALYVLYRAEWSTDEMQERLDKESDVRFTSEDQVYLQSIIDDYRQKIALAEAEYLKGVNNFERVSNVREANELTNDGHEFIQSGNRYMESAHAELVEFVQEFKARSIPPHIQ